MHPTNINVGTNLETRPPFQEGSAIDLKQIATSRFGHVLVILSGELKDVTIFKAITIQLANFFWSIVTPQVPLNSSADRNIVEYEVIKLFANKLQSEDKITFEAKELELAKSLISRFGNEETLKASHKELHEILQELTKDKALTKKLLERLPNAFKQRRLEKTKNLAQELFTRPQEHNNSVQPRNSATLPAPPPLIPQSPDTKFHQPEKATRANDDASKEGPPETPITPTIPCSTKNTFRQPASPRPEDRATQSSQPAKQRHNPKTISLVLAGTLVFAVAGVAALFFRSQGNLLVNNQEMTSADNSQTGSHELETENPGLLATDAPKERNQTTTPKLPNFNVPGESQPNLTPHPMNQDNETDTSPLLQDQNRTTPSKEEPVQPTRLGVAPLKVEPVEKDQNPASLQKTAEQVNQTGNYILGAFGVVVAGGLLTLLKTMTTPFWRKTNSTTSGGPQTTAAVGQRPSPSQEEVVEEEVVVVVVEEEEVVEEEVVRQATTILEQEIEFNDKVAQLHNLGLPANELRKYLIKALPNSKGDDEANHAYLIELISESIVSDSTSSLAEKLKQLVNLQPEVNKKLRDVNRRLNIDQIYTDSLRAFNKSKDDIETKYVALVSNLSCIPFAENLHVTALRDKWFSNILKNQTKKHGKAFFQALKADKTSERDSTEHKPLKIDLADWIIIREAQKGTDLSDLLDDLFFEQPQQLSAMFAEYISNIGEQFKQEKIDESSLLIILPWLSDRMTILSELYATFVANVHPSLRSSVESDKGPLAARAFSLTINPTADSFDGDLELLRQRYPLEGCRVIPKLIKAQKNNQPDKAKQGESPDYPGKINKFLQAILPSSQSKNRNQEYDDALAKKLRLVAENILKEDCETEIANSTLKMIFGHLLSNIRNRGGTQAPRMEQRLEDLEGVLLSTIWNIGRHLDNDHQNAQQKLPLTFEFFKASYIAYFKAYDPSDGFKNNLNCLKTKMQKYSQEFKLNVDAYFSFIHELLESYKTEAPSDSNQSREPPSGTDLTLGGPGKIEG